MSSENTKKRIFVVAIIFILIAGFLVVRADPDTTEDAPQSTETTMENETNEDSENVEPVQEESSNEQDDGSATDANTQDNENETEETPTNNTIEGGQKFDNAPL